jgi:hypothetical protein
MDVNNREKGWEIWDDWPFFSREGTWGVHRMDTSAASQDLPVDIAARHDGCNRVGII